MAFPVDMVWWGGGFYDSSLLINGERLIMAAMVSCVFDMSGTTLMIRSESA